MKAAAAAVKRARADQSSVEMRRPRYKALERGAYAGSEDWQVGHVVVGEQGHRELTVIGQRGDTQPHTGDEGSERHGLQ
jgi:hypothetical protein